MRGMRGERAGGKGNEQAENQMGTKPERLRIKGKLLKSNDPASEKQLFLSRMRIESMNPNSGKRRGKSRGQTEKRARMRSALLACGVSLQLRHDGRKGAEKRPARDGERCRGEEEKQGHSPRARLPPWQ